MGLKRGWISIKWKLFVTKAIIEDAIKELEMFWIKPFLS
jgi:hypothetical protein